MWVPGIWGEGEGDHYLALHRQAELWKSVWSWLPRHRFGYAEFVYDPWQVFSLNQYHVEITLTNRTAFLDVWALAGKVVVCVPGKWGCTGIFMRSVRTYIIPIMGRYPKREREWRRSPNNSVNHWVTDKASLGYLPLKEIFVIPQSEKILWLLFISSADPYPNGEIRIRSKQKSYGE